MFTTLIRAAGSFFLGCLLLIAFSGRAQAHPHVWIDMRVGLVFDDARQLSALRISWTFDEFYSAYAVEEFKKNKDGSYNPADLAKLAAINLENLKEVAFFTEVMVNGKAIPTGTPEEGQSTWDIKAGQLSLSFLLPLKTPQAASAAAPLQFRIYDPSYYIDIDYVKDNPVSYASGNHDGCSYSSRIPNAENVWSSLPEAAFSAKGLETLGLNFATTTTLICEPKP